MNFCLSNYNVEDHADAVLRSSGQLSKHQTDSFLVSALDEVLDESLPVQLSCDQPSTFQDFEADASCDQPDSGLTFRAPLEEDELLSFQLSFDQPTCEADASCAQRDCEVFFEDAASEEPVAQPVLLPSAAFDQPDVSQPALHCEVFFDDAASEEPVASKPNFFRNIGINFSRRPFNF